MCASDSCCQFTSSSVEESHMKAEIDSVADFFPQIQSSLRWLVRERGICTDFTPHWERTGAPTLYLSCFTLKRGAGLSQELFLVPRAFQEPTARVTPGPPFFCVIYKRSTLLIHLYLSVYVCVCVHLLN